MLTAKSQKNVTLFLGDNGSGKTTLLNAFIWILYNKHTSGFIQHKEIVNKKAIFEAETGTTIEAWGELEFEHNDYQYIIKRVTKAYKKDFTVFESFSDMLARRINDTRSRINQDGKIGNLKFGSDIGEIYTDYKQGELTHSGNDFNFAISNSNKAFFTLGIMDEDGEIDSNYFTRNGELME